MEALSSKRNEIQTWERFAIVLASLVFFSSIKRFRLSLFIFSASVLEITAEHLLFYLREESLITGYQYHIYMSSLRRFDFPIYTGATVLSIAASFLSKKKSKPAKAEDLVTESELTTILNAIEKRISVEEKARKKERKQFKEQFLSMQQQLNSSLTVPQSVGANHSIPASVMKRKKMSTTSMVTPFHNRNLRVHVSDNGGAIGFASPQSILSPQAARDNSENTLLHASNESSVSDHRKRRQDEICESEESLNRETMRTGKRQKKSGAVIN